mmetsp:Transcript_7720/g.17637  ORF Transcript_7720/g.17637 Transcript_7720/m.17637 type:complete len:311 (-) Transcript_7720:127-1059(-)
MVASAGEDSMDGDVTPPCSIERREEPDDNKELDFVVDWQTRQEHGRKSLDHGEEEVDHPEGEPLSVVVSAFGFDCTDGVEGSNHKHHEVPKVFAHQAQTSRFVHAENFGSSLLTTLGQPLHGFCKRSHILKQNHPVLLPLLVAVLELTSRNRQSGLELAHMRRRAARSHLVFALDLLPILIQLRTCSDCLTGEFGACCDGLNKTLTHLHTFPELERTQILAETIVFQRIPRIPEVQDMVHNFVAQVTASLFPPSQHALPQERCHPLVPLDVRGKLDDHGYNHPWSGDGGQHRKRFVNARLQCRRRLSRCC